MTRNQAGALHPARGRRKGRSKMAKKTPEIGENYNFAFGLPAEKQIVYLGGIEFRLVNGTSTKQVQSLDTYNKIVAYINGPTIAMGPIA